MRILATFFVPSRFAGLVFLAAALAGCGGGDAGVEGRQPVYKATGTITLNGAPVSDALVSFSPKGKQPAATGRTDSTGKFTLRTYEADDGVAAGDYTVLVDKTAVASSAVPSHDAFASGGGGPDIQHAEDSGPKSSSELPEKYRLLDQSDLAATVSSSGPNEFKFDLKP